MLEVNHRRSGTLADEYVVVRSIGCSIQYRLMHRGSHASPAMPRVMTVPID